MRNLILCLSLFLLAACATTTPPYLYYGNSSAAYYSYVKKADDQSRINYKQSLETVFSKSKSLGIKVPPGIYCDYALLMLAENNPSDAMEFFQKEKVTWPESSMMVDLLIQKWELEK